MKNDVPSQYTLIKWIFTKVKYGQLPIWSADHISWMWISMEKASIKQL